MMDFLAIPFAWVLKLCYQFTALFNGSGNYVISLLLFAIIMQLLLSPFGIIQQRNMVKQAKMRPMEYLIRKKYAGRNDRATMQKMQNEIMELYQKEGYSPLKGCLPMLLQLVIIFPLYQVVIRPLQFITGLSKGVCATIVTCFKNYTVEGKNVFDVPRSGEQVYVSNLISENKDKLSEIITAIPNADKEGEFLVSAEQATKALEELGDVGELLLPDVTIFGQNLGAQPFNAFGDFKGLWFLLLIPVINLGLMYLSQFVSKKLNPQQQMEQAQAGGGAMNSMKIMMWTMPLMTFFFTFTFPGAIGIYWIFRTLLSMLQQFILSRIFKLPKYTEEDLRRIEKEMKEAKRGQHKRPDIVYEGGEGKPYKSLHHIDDDE